MDLHLVLLAPVKVPSSCVWDASLVQAEKLPGMTCPFSQFVPGTRQVMPLSKVWCAGYLLMVWRACNSEHWGSVPPPGLWWWELTDAASSTCYLHLASVGAPSVQQATRTPAGRMCVNCGKPQVRCPWTYWFHVENGVSAGLPRNTECSCNSGFVTYCHLRPQLIYFIIW